MLYIGLFKRIIPFVLTFAAGLFIASFFVSIVPNFSGWRETRRGSHCREHRELRKQNEELRQKYYELVGENSDLKRQISDSDVMLQNAVPPVELKEHRPPSPPKRPKHPRFDALQ